MTNSLSQDARKILNFWQDSLWQNLANELPLSERELFQFSLVGNSEVREGTLKLGLNPNATVWVAPVVWEHSTKANQFWIPLWIPAQYTAGKLTPCLENTPWIPPSQFDILSDNFLLTESIHQFDEYLRYDWFQEEDQKQLPLWPEFYAACLSLLDNLSENSWQERLKAKGYLSSDKAYLVEASKFRVWQPFMQDYVKLIDQEALSPVLQRFATVDAPLSDLLDLEEGFKYAASFCGRYPEPSSLTRSEYAAVTKTLAHEGGIWAINAPVGAGRERVLATIVASRVVSSTVTRNTIPKIYRLARYTSDFQCPIQTFSASHLYPKKDEAQAKIVAQCAALHSGQPLDRASLCQDLKHQLQLQYENYVTGLNLLENALKERAVSVFGEEGDPKQYLHALQQEDEAYEKEFLDLLALQFEMQRKKPDSLFSKLFSWRSAKKEQVPQQYLTLDSVGDRIRQVKVLRAKIHQQLVTVTDKMATATHGRLWQQWLEDNQLKIPQGLFKKQDLVSLIQHAFSEKLWQLAIYYWLAEPQANSDTMPLKESVHRSLYRGWTLCQWQVKPFLGWQVVERMEDEVDLILIEDANRLLPQQVAPFLAQAKQVVMLGDEKDLPPLTGATLVQQEEAIARYQLDEDEIQEEMHYKGMMISAGNAFQVALKNATHQEEENRVPHLCLEERHAAPLFQDYLYLLDNKRAFATLKCSPLPAEAVFFTLDVKGKCTQELGGCLNMLEAQAIIDWLKTGSYAGKSKSVVVVTPFPSQRNYLKALLSQHQLSVEVVTFYQLEAKSWDCVVFSPVYTKEESRPFKFDQGDNWIYSLVIRASEALWVIGDLAIFDPKMHSPSGCLAKVIYLNQKQEAVDSAILV